MGIGGGSAELRSARGGVPRLVVAILVAVAGLTILTMLAAALALLSFTRGHAYDPVPALSSLPKGEPGTPPARTNAALAYDDATRQLILFGGQSVNGDALDDTWNWDGSEWRRTRACCR